MSSKIPVVRQVAWISIIPHLLVMGTIMLIWYQFNKTDFILLGAATYLITSQLLRRNIAKEHRMGMALIKHEQFEESITHFQNSYNFFKKHEWIDQYRYLTLLSSGKMTYKEMALVNIAFCYGQLGKGNLSKEYYERTLKEYPNSIMAKASLRMLNAMTGSEKEV